MTQSRLDPRDPFVVDTRPLGRQPGSMRTVNRIVNVSEALATPMASIPEGAEIELDLRLEAVMEGVLVTGTVRGRMTAECSRCLDPLSEGLETSYQELFRYESGENEGIDGEDADEDEEDYYLRASCSTSNPWSETPSFSLSRSHRCAVRTVPACAPSAGSSSPRPVPTTVTANESTPVGRLSAISRRTPANAESTAPCTREGPATGPGAP